MPKENLSRVEDAHLGQPVAKFGKFRVACGVPSLSIPRNLTAVFKVFFICNNISNASNTTQ